MITTVRSLEQYRRQINLPKPHKISDFIRKSPKLFISGGISVASDFRINWVHKFPQHFKVVKLGDEDEYLELVSWNPAWSITELEKKTLGLTEENDHKPGLLSLAFPMKFPPSDKKIYTYKGKIEHFQKRSYLSPYVDARGLEAGSKEFDKRAIVVMHELLNFTLRKRLVTDHLTYFRREFVMPQKLMRIFLKHCGIFYVSERGKRFSIFLTEAYQGPELIVKCPLIHWKEKLLKFTGYRGRKRDILTYSDTLDMAERELLESHTGDEDFRVGFEKDDEKMDIDEVNDAYKEDSKV